MLFVALFLLVASLVTLACNRAVAVTCTNTCLDGRAADAGETAGKPLQAINAEVAGVALQPFQHPIFG